MHRRTFVATAAGLFGLPLIVPDSHGVLAQERIASRDVPALIPEDQLVTRQETVRLEPIGEVPVLAWAPREAKGRPLVIWLTGFSGNRDSVQAQLKELARNGYIAVSFDPFQHGERRIEPQPELVSRVRGNIRRYFWPILAKTAEEIPVVASWAMREFGAREQYGVGGVSMGGDISVAAANVDRRIRAVSACVAAPEWLRPGSFEPPGMPDAEAQAHYDRRNPMTHLSLYAPHKPAIAFQSGAIDRQVPPDGGERFVEGLRPKYGKDAGRLKVNLQPGMGHGFSKEMWQWSLDWFREWLPTAADR